MKGFRAGTALVAVAFTAIVTAARADDPDLEQHWQVFRATYDRVYSGQKESDYRRGIFSKNLQAITRHNENYERGLVSYTVKITNFADMLPEEYKVYIFGKSSNFSRAPARLPIGESFPEPVTAEQLPEHVDWRTLGAVTRVKNQGLTCGSCWAFAAVGALEGQYSVKYGVLRTLSEQSAIDCTRIYGNDGCEGGGVGEAYEYFRDSDFRLDSEKSYPYEGRAGKCRSKARTSAYRDRPASSSYFYLRPRDEESLKIGIAAAGPIASAIDASDDMFRFYSTGIYHNPGCRANNLNHAVLIVGYGSSVDSGGDYWLVKNSWGETWGEGGYFRIARNHGNHCGVASEATFPSMLL